jgi:AcrR family transcriptional regulator
MPRAKDGRVVPAASRAANPRPETAEKRQRILEAAMAIFATRGYNNGSLIEIGEAAGVSHTGVIHHFGSKDQLLIATLEYRDDSDVAELEGKHIPDGAALFDHLVHTVELNQERPGVVQLYAVLSADSVTEGHPAQSYFRDRFVGLREMVKGGLRDVVPHADEANVDLAASTIIATMDGLQVQWLLDPSAVDMTAAVRLVIDAVIAQLTATTAPSA